LRLEIELFLDIDAHWKSAAAEARGPVEGEGRPTLWLQADGADAGHLRDLVSPASRGIDDHGSLERPGRRAALTKLVATLDASHLRIGDKLAIAPFERTQISTVQAMDVNVECFGLVERACDIAWPQQRQQRERPPGVDSLDGRAKISDLL